MIKLGAVPLVKASVTPPGITNVPGMTPPLTQVLPPSVE